MAIQPTSTESFVKNQALLANLKDLVFDLIQQADDDGISNHEIAAHLNVPTATVSGLTRPLVVAGLVKQLKKRPCKITGHSVIAWTSKGIQPAIF